MDGVERLGLGPSAGLLKLWDAKTGELKQDLKEEHYGQVLNAAFSPDGKFLASAGHWGLGTGVKLWNPQTGKVARVLAIPRGHLGGGSPLCVAFSPDGKRIAMGIMQYDKSTDVTSGSINIAYPASGILDLSWLVPHAVRPVAFSPDGKLIAAISAKNSLTLWDSSTGLPKREIRPAEQADGKRWECFAFAPQANMLAIGGIDAKGGFVEVWNLDGAAAEREKTSEAQSPQSAASLSRTFPLRFKLASAMADDLRQILLGRPNNEAKPSANNQEITVTAPAEVMKRVQTFISVMDWPDSITRRSNFEYPRESVLHAARSFYYACAIEDTEEVFSKLLSLQVLAELKGDTKAEHYFKYSMGEVPDPEWEKSLRADWPGKKEAIQRLVHEWNRYALTRITEDSGVAIGFGVKHFCSVSMDGAPKDFYTIEIEPDRTQRGTGKGSFFFNSLPPWWNESRGKLPGGRLGADRIELGPSDAKATGDAAVAEARSRETETIVLAEQPPVVVETFPVSGAREVAPGTMEIRVRFSKPMTDGSWSWSTAWENSTPEFIGQPHYEADGRTCAARVKLEAGRTYAFWLNSEKFKNFTDRAGRPAVPYLLIFQTKPK